MVERASAWVRNSLECLGLVAHNGKVSLAPCETYSGYDSIYSPTTGLRSFFCKVLFSKVCLCGWPLQCLGIQTCSHKPCLLEVECFIFLG